MPIVPLSDLKACFARRQRLMGIDLGSKTIGLALSDILGMTATPLETIKRLKFTQDAERLLALVKERQVGGLVLGLPLNMDGTEGPRCQSTRQFAINLLGKQDLPIAYWDERLSTAAVERQMIAADLTRKRRSELIDKAAAAYILDGALDALRRVPAQAPE